MKSPTHPILSEKTPPPSVRYYQKIAHRYQTACAVSILALLCYLVVILGAFGDYITYDNLQYLIRDLDTVVSSGENTFSNIQYDRQSEMTFAVFKNGLATAGKESFSLFDSSGLRLSENQISYTNPVLVPSSKYLLLYDLTGKDYAVYNALTRVIARVSDHKIIDGDMSDSGSFLLVTRSNETKYVVELYNDALNHTMSVYKDNYVMDAAINQDGSMIAVCSAVPSDTNFDCEISFYAKGNGATYNTVNLTDTMPLQARFFGNTLVVLCDNGLYFYDKDGVPISAYALQGMTLEYADMSRSYVVLACSENALGSENRILVFDLEGTVLADAVVRERVTGVCAPLNRSEKAVAYLLTPERVAMLTPGEGGGYEVMEETVKEGDVLAIRATGTGVVACTATAAVYLFN